MAKRAPAKRVAVIGAGPSGLTAIKACLEEGLEPVCFEKTNTLGGLWYYREDRTELSCVFRSTIINTSKETMCFSDYPIPDDWPNFLHNIKVLEYFKNYAVHFGLLRYITYKTKVNTILPADDFDLTGRWKLSLTTTDDGATRDEIFDAVFICTGHHCTPNIPKFVGMNDFKGEVLHTHDYLIPDKYRGKRIVVVGMGNSGVDAAVELGRVASKLFLSTRSGAWITLRMVDRCLPGDLVNRFNRSYPLWLQDYYARAISMNRVDHEFLGIKPNFSITAAHPTVNDDLPGCIASGFVNIKPNVRRFTERGVVFDDGSEEALDLVVLATGYKIAFPYIPQSVLPINDNHVEMYKFVFNPEHKHPTMAVLGMVQPIGPIMPVSELQARWASRVFKGINQLPSREVMTKRIKKRNDDMAKRYKKSPRHTIQVDVLPYMDEVAREIKAKPNFFWLLLTDPVLAYHYLFSPFIPAQYRVAGPHPWSRARKHMMTVWPRIMRPYKTRHGGNESMKIFESQRSGFGFLKFFLLLGAISTCGLALYRRPTWLGQTIDVALAFFRR
ncbi:flavin-containing monooxygenase 5-like [Lytechinus pictus]|uniref:flavin-containing monooxygenase 5-like n=1 Tax=Lytechinus pictus TaxID=7653 RepID=UPI0030B9CC0F